MISRRKVSFPLQILTFSLFTGHLQKSFVYFRRFYSLNFPKNLIHEKNPYPSDAELFIISGSGPGPVFPGL